MINLQDKYPTVISKVLSHNDTGETGAHQAGILIPKNERIITFFPKLGTESKNPRVKMRFIDDSGQEWNFTFIYYNNKFFGGTRNEFRLTGMTAFIKQNNLVAGDKIVLSHETEERSLINYERVSIQNSPTVLKLGSSWKVVKI